MDHMDHAEVKRQYVHVFFRHHYKEWVGTGLTDDRQLFCNLYEMLLEAIRNMAQIENNYIWLAFNERFVKTCNQMAEIQKRFPL